MLRHRKRKNSFDINQIPSKSKKVKKDIKYHCFYCGKYDPKCIDKKAKTDPDFDDYWEVSTKRMKKAVFRFLISSKHPVLYLRNRILGHRNSCTITEKLPGITGYSKSFWNKRNRYVVTLKAFSFNPMVVSAPKLSALNSSQKDAIIHSIESPLSLIQGPPGTGKTVTAATLVYNLVTKYGEKVLVCAPSNTAVDNLTEKIWKTGLNVVRVLAQSREEMECMVPHIALHNIILEKDPKLKGLHQLKKRGELKTETDDYKLYLRLKNEREIEVLKEAKVICCTCICAGDKRINEFQYNSVLIDEASQASVPECLVPIVMASKRIVLVGDHKQLGPVIKCQKGIKGGFERSLFEKLIIDFEITPKLLEIQYRMHPSLSQFPSLTFYDNKLINDVTTSQRTMKCGFPWPQSGQPFCFICVKGMEETYKSGTSYMNEWEALEVDKIVFHYFIKERVKPHKIGIITPYKAQQEYLSNYIKNIDIYSVNKFQGQEKEFIIFSCVRSHKRIGFLSDPRRLNVALTRARSGLIIVGNPTVLSKDKHWNQLLHYYREHNVLVEGPLHNLKPCVCLLSDTNNEQA